MAGTKINEYPQAAALNDADLLVMDQVQSGIHSTKSVSIGQITDKATSGLTDNNLPHYTGTPTQGSTAEAIGDLSTLTTTDKSSLVGAVNEVNANKQDKITVVTTVSGSTDNTGNFVVPDISPSTHMLLSAYKVRTSPNTDIAMSSIGVNGSQTAYLVHLALTDGTAYASKSNVVLKIAYIAL